MIATASMTYNDPTACAETSLTFGVVDWKTLDTEVITVVKGEKYHEMVLRNVEGEIINSTEISTEKARYLFLSRMFEVVDGEVIFVSPKFEKGGA